MLVNQPLTRSLLTAWMGFTLLHVAFASSIKKPFLQELLLLLLVLFVIGSPVAQAEPKFPI